MNEYRLTVVVRLHYAAYNERDAQILTMKIQRQLERAAEYSEKKWGVRLDGEVDEPIFLRHFAAEPDEERSSSGRRSL